MAQCRLTCGRPRRMSGFKICTHLADVGEGLVVTVEEAVGLHCGGMRLRHMLPLNSNTHGHVLSVAI